MASKWLVVNVYFFILVNIKNIESLECYKCSNSTNINQCNDIIQCSSDQSCFHDSLTVGHAQIYSLGCIDRHQCGAHRDGTSAMVGRNLQAQTDSCHECCSTDNCNKPLCEHFKPSACIDDHKIDCAYLNTVTNVCSDTQHARTICPRFCDLCSIVDGNWSEWSKWSTCDVTCGNGTQTRKRLCSNPSPADGGLNCTGSTTDVKECSPKHCPVVSTTISTSSTQTLTSTTFIRSTDAVQQSSTSDIHTSPTEKPIPFVLGNIAMCSTKIQSLSNKSGEIIAQFGNSCYELVHSAISWLHASTYCKSQLGHLTHIENQREQDFIYNLLLKYHSRSVWIGLHDRDQEENFEWSSGNNVTYLNWKPGRKDNNSHGHEDCVVMTSATGQWDDVSCGGSNTFSELFGAKHSFICQYETVSYSVSTNGNVMACPDSVQQQTLKDNGDLGHHAGSCYELIKNDKVSWQHAQEKCNSRHGNLVTIKNAQGQAFIQQFLERYSPNHAVWIGLFDRVSEGHFRWASGAPVQFTNWIPGHIANYASSGSEDCVAFLPYKDGKWDDIPCGYTQHSLFTGTSSSGEIHPYLCEFHISSNPSLVG